MKKQKLNYRFHNPNDPAVTAEYILKVFIEVNQKKVEEAIRKASEKEQIPEQESEVTRSEERRVGKECDLGWFSGGGGVG